MGTVYYLLKFSCSLAATRDGRRGKTNIKIPVGLTAAAAQTPTRK